MLMHERLGVDDGPHNQGPPGGLPHATPRFPLLGRRSMGPTHQRCPAPHRTCTHPVPLTMGPGGTYPPPPPPPPSGTTRALAPRRLFTDFLSH
jgi:hypothetical protein